jgi:hypothetical protein
MFRLLGTTDKIEGYQPSNISDKDLENFKNSLPDTYDKDYKYAIYGAPCNYTSKQVANGLGCGYYALRNKCPDGSGRGYFECLK